MSDILALIAFLRLRIALPTPQTAEGAYATQRLGSALEFHLASKYRSTKYKNVFLMLVKNPPKTMHIVKTVILKLTAVSI